MVTTYTQHVYKTSKIGTTFINPSIMEGERGLSSLYGEDSALRITRFAPTFTNAPTISGEPKVPATLTCNPGTQEASPQATIFYQWKSNGVDIPGETASTFDTDAADDTNTLTCEVTAVNFLGVAVAESNGIVAVLVLPIEVVEQGLYAIQGMNSKNFQTLMTFDMFAVQGLPVDTAQTCMGVLAFVITGLNQENVQTMNAFDIYAVCESIFDVELALVNPSADSGFTGWTISSGAPTAEFGTTYYWRGDNTGPTTENVFYQDIAVPVASETDIDAGTHSLQLDGDVGDYYGYDDGVRFRAFFYNAGSTLIGSSPTTAWDSWPNGSGWNPVKTPFLEVPPLTRTIRVQIEMYSIQFSSVSSLVGFIRAKLYTQANGAIVAAI
jgi:hypothetical protein